MKSNSTSVAKKKASGGMLETVKTIVYAVLIALVVRTVAYEPFNIPSGSMIPTLLVGDYLFVSKFTYGYSRYSLPFGLPLFSGRIYLPFSRLPERGDVVVFKLPTDPSTDYIKRIVGRIGRQFEHDNIAALRQARERDRKSTRLNSSHSQISYADFCLKKTTGFQSCAHQHRSPALRFRPTPCRRR